MADKFLTLTEMTKRNGTDQAIGLVEEVNTVAPELESLKGRSISGTTYKIKKRTVLPAGPAFRKANVGSDIVSSTYANELAQCFFLDAQMQIDEMVVKSGLAEGNSLEDILADEAVGVMTQKLINVGDQFYRGTTANADGFLGLKSLYDTTNCEVDATGTPGSATSVWLVWNDLQGLHWIYGNGMGVEMGDWQRQQVVAPTGTGKLHAYTNNASGWLGLSFGHTRSIVRAKNITTAANKGFTDAMGAEMIQKLPIFMRRSPNLRFFMNSTAELLLRKSRSTVSTAKTDSGILQFAPPVTECQGVPVILTDSIPNNE
jgi:hypothetical protein